MADQKSDPILQAANMDDDSDPVALAGPQSETYRAAAPVRSIPGDPSQDQPEEGIALCLSGGGYRAMLFHLGCLWRLNHLGLLPLLKRVSSVSGGSITAGVLGLIWGDLDFDEYGTARRFDELVVGPIRRLADHTLDVPGAVRGFLFNFFSPGIAARYVAAAYRQHLFGDHTLRDLPDDKNNKGPRFVINSTNLQSGVLWRFSRPYIADYLVGCITKTDSVDLATAVAASSAFPPILSPMVLHFKEADYSPCPPPYEDAPTPLHNVPFTTNVILTDGGVYDNLGLETAWKRYRTVLVSDGGAKTAPEPQPRQNWVSQFMRVREAQENQVRSLRKRQLQTSYALPPGTPGQRFGAYWTMRIDITRYEVPGTLYCPYPETFRLAKEPTRLAKLYELKQKHLVNWGYAVCDAALRRAALDGKLPIGRPLEPPTGFPYPEAAWKVPDESRT